MPEKRIAELITVALKNCADHELELEVGAGAPRVLREQAAQLSRLPRHPKPEPSARSQTADAVLAI